MKPFPDDTDYSEPMWDGDTVYSDTRTGEVADKEPKPPIMTLADYRVIDNRIAQRANVIARQPHHTIVGYLGIIMLNSMSRAPPMATCRVL